MKLLWQFSLIILFAITLSAQPTQAAPDLPPCGQRPHLIDPPWVNANYYCAELVIHDESGGEMGFTSLAAAPDGTLYATRPLSGEVFALIDTDQDLLLLSSQNIKASKEKKIKTNHRMASGSTQ